MGKKRRKGLIAAALAAALAMQPCALPGTEAEAAGASAQEPTRVSVHDPSIIKADGKYYLFGTHLADAKSDDLIHWTQMNPDWNMRGGDSWKQDSVYGNVLENLAESFQWAGYDDGDVKDGGLGVWAPDVIYNPSYSWKDGSKGAYMLYYSASSTWRRSCIGYAVSKTVEGPYQYVDTIIYSGFTKTGEADNGANGGVSTRDTHWDNDYLNLKELIDAGRISGVSDNWFTQEGGWNERYAPNAIDPTAFFGKDGGLYLVYGSWSGGLFIQELDPETGDVNYPGKDGVEPISGNTVDRYFGTHIAGGNHQSGEGAYILYDAETDYYYLYETYGGLLSTGGYNMRLFRSENIYGPYMDAAGNNAKDSGADNEKYGIKLIGNYAFTGQPGYRAAGHCSALIDEDGQRYLFYHQRFDSPGFQHEGHQVRVRQQFLNEDGWPVAAVYEYRGEQIGHYEDDAAVGEYEVIDHGTDTSGDMISPQKIELCADGSVKGAMTGTWRKSQAEGKAYDYIRLSLGGVIYKGYFFQQYNEESPAKKVMTFSAIGGNNTCLWGTCTSKYEEEPSEEEPSPPSGGEGEKPSPPVTAKKGAQAISVKASYSKVYGGKAFSLKAKLTKGDGTLSYASDAPRVAAVGSKTGKVEIKGTGIARITVTASETASYRKKQAAVTIKVAPKKVSLASVKAKKGGKASVKWKAAAQASGYEIQYAANAKFKSAKRVTVAKAKATSAVIRKLKSKKTYYFRVRAYKKPAKGGKIYGAYSKAGKLKVK